MVEQYYVIAWSSSLRIFKCVLVRVQSRCRQVRVAHALLCGHACTNTEVTCHIRLYLGMITGVHFFFISLDKKFEIQDIWFQKGDLHQLEGGSLVNASARACVATLLGCVVRTLCK